MERGTVGWARCDPSVVDCELRLREQQERAKLAQDAEIAHVRQRKRDEALEERRQLLNHYSNYGLAGDTGNDISEYVGQHDLEQLIQRNEKLMREQTAAPSTVTLPPIRSAAASRPAPKRMSLEPSRSERDVRYNARQAQLQWEAQERKMEMRRAYLQQLEQDRRHKDVTMTEQMPSNHAGKFGLVGPLQPIMIPERDHHDLDHHLGRQEHTPPPDHWRQVRPRVSGADQAPAYQRDPAMRSTPITAHDGGDSDNDTDSGVHGSKAWRVQFDPGRGLDRHQATRESAGFVHDPIDEQWIGNGSEGASPATPPEPDTSIGRDSSRHAIELAGIVKRDTVPESGADRGRAQQRHKQEEYARALRQQIREKQAPSRGEFSEPERFGAPAPSHDDERRKKQQCVDALQQQIRERPGRRRTEPVLAGLFGADTTSDSDLRTRKQEYARALQAQIEQKRMERGRRRQDEPDVKRDDSGGGRRSPNYVPRVAANTDLLTKRETDPESAPNHEFPDWNRPERDRFQEQRNGAANNESALMGWGERERRQSVVAKLEYARTLQMQIDERRRRQRLEQEMSPVRKQQENQEETQIPEQRSRAQKGSLQVDLDVATATAANPESFGLRVGESRNPLGSDLVEQQTKKAKVDEYRRQLQKQVEEKERQKRLVKMQEAEEEAKLLEKIKKENEEMEREMRAEKRREQQGQNQRGSAGADQGAEIRQAPDPRTSQTTDNEAGSSGGAVRPRRPPMPRDADGAIRELTVKTDEILSRQLALERRLDQSSWSLTNTIVAPTTNPSSANLQFAPTDVSIASRSEWILAPSEPSPPRSPPEPAPLSSSVRARGELDVDDAELGDDLSRSDLSSESDQGADDIAAAGDGVRIDATPIVRPVDIDAVYARNQVRFNALDVSMRRCPSRRPAADVDRRRASIGAHLSKHPPTSTVSMHATTESPKTTWTMLTTAACWATQDGWRATRGRRGHDRSNRGGY